MRAVGAVIVFYSSITLGSVVVWLVLPTSWHAIHGGLFAQTASLLLSAMVAYWVIAALGWASWSLLGWPGLARAVKGMGLGVAVGSVMAGAALVLAIGPGSAGIAVSGWSTVSYLGAALPIAGLLLLAALAEELLFRGYPLQRLATRFGKVPATLSLAVVFALAHLVNPDSSALGMVNVGLASFLMSVVFFTSGRLPAAWGLHFGWNAGLALAADAPVSGIRFGLPGLAYSPGGPSWFTGGDFGPEGGAVASAVMLAIMLLLVLNYSRLTEDRTK
jgi:membrane protease YdiL (CAAX protease family)